MDLLFGDSPPPPTPPRRPLIRAGDPMPDLSLPRLGGGVEPLAALWADGPVALALGHSECPTSRFAFPFYERLRTRVASPARVEIVMQEDETGGLAFSRELALARAPLLELDPYPLAEALGLRTVPTLLWIERGGRVARVAEGFDRAVLEEVATGLGLALPLFTAAEATLRRRPG